MLKLNRRSITLHDPWEVQYDVEERCTIQNADSTKFTFVRVVCVCDVQTVVGCTEKMDQTSNL